jgi:hypothetical protein
MTEAEERAKARSLKIFFNRAKKKHGNRFNYDLLPLYLPDDKVITIRCKHHGKFSVTTISHLNGKNGGCSECRKVAMRVAKGETSKSFAKKGRETHEIVYDYSKVTYINTYTPVIISCPEHGDFKQQPRVHLKGSDCPKCARNLRNPFGWSYTNWKNAGDAAKYFDSFKVYILFCRDFTTGESFTKIGKTFNKVSSRFPKSVMPYEYFVLFTYEGSAEVMSKLEHELHQYYRAEKYIPKQEFGGQTECFKPDINIPLGITSTLSKVLGLDIKLPYSSEFDY